MAFSQNTETFTEVRSFVRTHSRQTNPIVKQNIKKQQLLGLLVVFAVGPRQLWKLSEIMVISLFIYAVWWYNSFRWYLIFISLFTLSLFLGWPQDDSTTIPRLRKGKVWIGSAYGYYLYLFSTQCVCSIYRLIIFLSPTGMSWVFVGLTPLCWLWAQVLPFWG